MEKKWETKCTRESCRECRARVQFFEETGEIWTVGEVIQVVLASVLRATTKKKVNFWVKKVHPRQNPGYATPMVPVSHRIVAMSGKQGSIVINLYVHIQSV